MHRPGIATMKLAAAIVASLGWTACTMAGPASAIIFEPGTAFGLKAGESAQARDGMLRVGFDGVTADSRCPKGVQCVWAGEATVQVWLQRGAGPKEARSLHLPPGKGPAVRILDLELRLLRLDPHPVGERSIAPTDYVATLIVGPPVTDPDR
jgi:hypothetical protein